MPILPEPDSAAHPQVVRYYLHVRIEFEIEHLPAEVQFGDRATKLPAKNAPEAVVRVVRKFNDERNAGESFQSWLARSGGASAIGKQLAELDEFPAPDVGPEFYVDYDETGPYVADVGDGECAAT